MPLPQTHPVRQLHIHVKHSEHTNEHYDCLQCYMKPFVDAAERMHKAIGPSLEIAQEMFGAFPHAEKETDDVKLGELREARQAYEHIRHQFPFDMFAEPPKEKKRIPVVDPYPDLDSSCGP